MLLKNDYDDDNEDDEDDIFECEKFVNFENNYISANINENMKEPLFEEPEE